MLALGSKQEVLEAQIKAGNVRFDISNFLTGALPLQARLVPTINSILIAQSQDQCGGLKSEALDVLATLVRCSPTPLSDHLVEVAFPATVQATLSTDDNSILQG